MKTARADQPTARELRDAFGMFATGVTVVTGVRPDGEPVGLTVNSFSSVSLEPPLLLWSIHIGSESVAAFAVGAPFSVHVLSDEQRDLALHFSRRKKHKFEVDEAWRATQQPPVLADVLCRFDCQVHALCPAGDHIVVIGAVLALQRQPGMPLAFFAGRFTAVSLPDNSPQIDPWDAWKEGWV
ncbi:MAG: flavin reductase family protein [Pseudomonadota bacterium]|jgi:hypothetical protein